MVRLAHAFVVSSCFVPSAIAQHELLRVNGSAKQEQLGTALAAAGDVDGDGVPDLVAAADGGDLVRVLSGATGATIHFWSFATRLRTLSLSVAIGDDVDADGFADIVVGDPNDQLDYGAAYLYSGQSGSLLWSVTANTSELLGASAANLGDVDGDGIDDLAVTAWSYYPAPSHVRILRGIDGSELRRYQGNATVFETVTATGDVDGDSIPDFAVTAIYDEEVHLVSGATAALILVISRPTSAEGFPSSLAAVSDFDGDGRRDLLVGADDSSSSGGGLNAGRVFVLSSADGSILWKNDGIAAYGGYGFAAADAGDVDGDGASDFLVGAPRDPAGGYVELRSGRDATLLHRFRGEVDDRFGQSLSTMGDLDGDGWTDVVIGSPRDDAPANRTGSVHVFAGSDLFVQLEPTAAAAYDAVALTTRAGPPGALAAFALVDVSGVPMHLLVSLGLFDAASSYGIAGTVPAGLSGVTFTFVGYGDDVFGRMRDSERTTLTFQ